MGSTMSTRLKHLIQERKLMKTRIARDMIRKEIEAAQSDLGDARTSFDQGKLKWATIQGYYSMFHSARSLLYSKDYREKSHYAPRWPSRNYSQAILTSPWSTHSEMLWICVRKPITV